MFSDPGERQRSQPRVRRHHTRTLGRVLTLAGLGAAAWLFGGAAAAVADELPVDPAAQVAQSAEAAQEPTEGRNADANDDAAAAESGATETTGGSQDAGAAGEHGSAPVTSEVTHSLRGEATATVHDVSDTVHDVAEAAVTGLSQAPEGLPERGELPGRAQDSLAEAGATLDTVIRESSEELPVGKTELSPDITGSFDGAGAAAGDALEASATQRNDAEAPAGSHHARASTERGDERAERTSRDVEPEEPGSPRPEEAGAGPQGATPADVTVAVAEVETTSTQPRPGAPVTAMSAPTLESTAGVSGAGTAPGQVAADNLGPRLGALPAATERVTVPDGPMVVVPGATTDASFSPD